MQQQLFHYESLHYSLMFWLRIWISESELNVLWMSSGEYRSTFSWCSYRQSSFEYFNVSQSQNTYIIHTLWACMDTWHCKSIRQWRRKVRWAIRLFCVVVGEGRGREGQLIVMAWLKSATSSSTLFAEEKRNSTGIGWPLTPLILWCQKLNPN